MATAITTAPPLEHYEREGYAIFRGVIDAELVAEANQHVAWLIARNPEVRPERLAYKTDAAIGDGPAWLRDPLSSDPFWVRLVSDPRLLDIAEHFIGPDIALFATGYFSKPPRDGRPVLWHQDGSYWPLDPMKIVSLWLAVDDSTAENGCMRVIPGSHLHDYHALEARIDVANVFSSGMDESLVDESQAVDVALKAGDVSVHHPGTIHGSNANNSDKRRCGLTIRYIPTSTRILTDRQWPSAFLLRGEAVPGTNAYLPFPRYEEGKHMPFRDSARWS